MAILRPSIFSAGWTLLAAEQVESLPPHLQVGDFDGDGEPERLLLIQIPGQRRPLRRNYKEALVPVTPEKEPRTQRVFERSKRAGSSVAAHFSQPMPATSIGPFCYYG
jgi:hypothetical protein